MFVCLPTSCASRVGAGSSPRAPLWRASDDGASPVPAAIGHQPAARLSLRIASAPVCSDSSSLFEVESRHEAKGGLRL